MYKFFLFGLLCGAAGVYAGSAPLAQMTDAQLLARWNKQADLYNRAYVLKNCTNRKVAAPNHSALLCETVGEKGMVSFVRKEGALQNVGYSMEGHPVTDASMFVRFVRGTHTGNMGQVGVDLLSRAKKSGNDCVSEEAARICAAYASGDFMIEARP